jgi:hypothetical protein
MKNVIFILSFIISLSAAANLGHRLGEKEKIGQENSETRLRSNWKHQVDSKFEYWEFDVVETKDKKLAVVHDRDFKKLGDKTKVKELTLAQIKKKHTHVLGLSELFNLFQQLDYNKFEDTKLVKPIRVEVKRIYTDEGRYLLISRIKNARKNISSKISIHAISFDNFKIKHFKKSFPNNRDMWAKKFSEAKINMLKVGSHKKDLFGNPLYKIEEDLPEVPSNPKESWFDKIKNWFKDLF